MAQMLVRLEVKYGQMARFCDVMAQLVPLVEKAGDMKLLGAWQTTLGRLHEVWDLWDVPPGFQGITSISLGAGAVVDGRNLLAELADCVNSEELRLIEKLPYSS